VAGMMIVNCLLTSYSKKQSSKFSIFVIKPVTSYGFYVYNLQMTENGDAYKMWAKMLKGRVQFRGMSLSWMTVLRRILT
jgi:hypothetical protein